MLIEMKVAGITIDAYFNTPIIILKDLKNDCSLPIWVGPFEAQAIAFGINGNGLPRPLPYDIMKYLMLYGHRLKRILNTTRKKNILSR